MYRALIRGATHPRPSLAKCSISGVHTLTTERACGGSRTKTLGQTQRTEFQLRDLETTSNIYLITVQAYLEQVLTMAGAHSVSVHRQKELLKTVVCPDYRHPFAIN